MAEAKFYVRHIPQGRETGPHDEKTAIMLAGRAQQDPEIKKVEIYRELPGGGKQLAHRFPD